MGKKDSKSTEKEKDLLPTAGKGQSEEIDPVKKIPHTMDRNHRGGENQRKILVFT